MSQRSTSPGARAVCSGLSLLEGRKPTESDPHRDSRPAALWRLRVIVALTMLVFVACGGGVDLMPWDADLADEYWSSMNQFEREAFCEDLGTGRGRATAAQTLKSWRADQWQQEFGLPADASEEDRRAYEAVGPPLEAWELGGPQQQERIAVKIVRYLMEKC